MMCSVNKYINIKIDKVPKIDKYLLIFNFIIYFY